MPSADDDLELVLRRCDARLSEISLILPELDAEGSRHGAALARDVLTLDAPARPARPAPPPAAPPAQTPPQRLPLPSPPAPPAPPALVAPPPAPVTEEHDVFPPPSYAAAGDVAAPLRPTGARPGWASPRALAAATALLVAVAFAAYRYSRAAGAVVQVPLERPVDGMAMRPERGDILVAEGSELLTISHTGAVLGREPLEAPVAAVDWDQGSTWTLDGRTAALIERREGQRPTRYGLNHVPNAVFVKDRYLWTADRGAHTIHQYLVSRSILGAILQPLDRIDLPGMDVETFAFDAAGDLWLVDSGRRSLYRLKSTGGVFKPVAAAPLSPLLGPTGEIRGLFLEEDGGLWLANNAGGRAVLRRIPAFSLDWAAAP